MNLNRIIGFFEDWGLVIILIPPVMYGWFHIGYELSLILGY